MQATHSPDKTDTLAQGYLNMMPLTVKALRENSLVQASLGKLSVETGKFVYTPIGQELQDVTTRSLQGVDNVESGQAHINLINSLADGLSPTESETFKTRATKSLVNQIASQKGFTEKNAMLENFPPDVSRQIIEELKARQKARISAEIKDNLGISERMLGSKEK